MKIHLETQRLILREWLPEDFAPFAAMNSDPAVMEYFLNPLTEEESLAFYGRIRDEFEAYGYGPYALERKADKRFIGFTGFHHFAFEADFSPGVEIGWRLMHDAWGRGYVPEAAEACLKYGAEKLGLKTVYSFTALPNLRSQRVMQKIGMVPDREFDHPLVPPGHPLLRHVLYKTEL